MEAALHQCTLLANQSSAVKNSGCLRVALLQHLFTAVLPIPLPISHPERDERCFWHSAPVALHEQASLSLSLSLYIYIYIYIFTPGAGRAMLLALGPGGAA